tara:strand:+ start:12266 stop:13234 length:969 start_codon:yes stop_codon:yes gene_type:complete
MKIVYQFHLLAISILFINCSSDEEISFVTINVETEVSQSQNTQKSLLNSNTTGVFSFSPTGPLSNKNLDIYFHIPEGDMKSLPILFSFHGGSRNANDYRDDWISMANQNNFMVFAPEFNSDNFPTGDMYNLANIFLDGDNPSAESYNSPENWTFSIIDQLFEFIKSEVDGNQESYNAWGHSAGAQFLHRFILYLPNSKLNTAVCSNAGWYTVPETGVSFPYGLNGSRLESVNLRDAFSKKVYIHLGEEDNNPNSSSLRHNDVVDNQQGRNRLVRGRYFFQKSKEKAESLDTEFNWVKTPEVPNVGHDHTAMALDALQFILQE